MVKADADENGQDSARPEVALPSRATINKEIDSTLLEDSLAKTPWERMQANDDALRFAELLRAAVEKRNAES